jgi:hypothetical protein
MDATIGQALTPIAINRTLKCRNFTISKSCQTSGMVGSSWMARKFNRGVTYQTKAKDLENAREYLYGVANIVI